MSAPSIADETRVLSFAEIVSALGRREFFLNLLPYFVVLIPLIVALNLAAQRLDARLGLLPLFDLPLRCVLFSVFLCAGLAIVWWSYAYLCLVGEGSPSPHLGGTRRLVRCGPYAAVRHPSVIGKLCGVIGAGSLFASPSFLLGMLPVLLCYSLLYNRFYQERGCVQIFGDDYLAYRREVPFIIPHLGRLARLVAQPPNAQWLSAWVLVCVLMLQLSQLCWLRREQSERRYVWVPLSFTSSGEAPVPSLPIASGPIVIGPTVTIEDIVRALLVMETHPEKGLRLSPTQRVIVARCLDEASRARDEMLAQARGGNEAQARVDESVAQMLEVLTEAQRRSLRDLAPPPSGAPDSASWAALVRALETGAR